MRDWCDFAWTNTQQIPRRSPTTWCTCAITTWTNSATSSPPTMTLCSRKGTNGRKIDKNIHDVKLSNFFVVRLTGLWKHLASEREKPLMEGCLTIPQIREQVRSFNMTSSNFSSCRSIYSLTIDIFELPPLEQHGFNCASRVVLSNGTLS